MYTDRVNVTKHATNIIYLFFKYKHRNKIEIRYQDFLFSELAISFWNYASFSVIVVLRWFTAELFRKRYDERRYYVNCTSWPTSSRLFGQSHASLARLFLICLDIEFLSLRIVVFCCVFTIFSFSCSFIVWSILISKEITRHPWYHWKEEREKRK